MNRLFLTLFLFIIVVVGKAQTFSVASFKALPVDLSARLDSPLKDQNGDLCAIIKVVTNETGFRWDGDRLGIVKAEKRTGEYWLYVPYGVKRLTIMHNKFGIIRDYIYPEPIEKACVYEMILKTDNIAIVNDNKEITTIWLVLKSNPTGSDVYINDVQKGVTPYPVKLTPGKYNCRLEKALYHTEDITFEITGEEPSGKKEINIDLKPAYGFLKITSVPENDATVYIDDIIVNGKTPVTSDKLKSGKHKVTVKKELFQSKSTEVNVIEGITTEEIIVLSPNFATVKVSSQPEADLFIDGDKVGNGSYNGRLSVGMHSFEAKKENYYSDKKEREMIAGAETAINLVLLPQVGNIDILSDPIEATVYLNGDQMGTTPLTIKKLLAGKYQIKFDKLGYKSVIKEVKVEEGKIVEINEVLIKGENSTPVSNAEEKVEEKVEEKIISKEVSSIITDARDGKSYKIVKIGNQIWTAENLNVSKLNDGSEILFVKDNKTWSEIDIPAYCWYENDAKSNGKIFGALYNWHTINTGKICPIGWHVPTDSEWSTLVEFLGGDLIAGGKLKEKGFNHWENPNNGASNETGFTALPGGIRKSDGKYNQQYIQGCWWSSSNNSSNDSFFRLLTSSGKSFLRSVYSIKGGFSVRCIKDN